MKKFLLFTLISVFLFSMAGPANADEFNLMGNSFEDSMKKFGNGFKGAIVDGVFVGVLSPIFKDSTKENLGYIIGGVPHGAFRGAMSVPGSSGGKIVRGVGDMVGGLVGWVPIAGPIVDILAEEIFDGIGGIFDFLGVITRSIN